MELLGNLKNSVAKAFSSNTSPPSISKSDVLGLEEGERSRRLTQVSQTNVDKQNAANISGLIKTQSFPVFRGNVSKGYKRVTTKFEEEERRRRLTNKSESALRRANANKTSRMLQELGWPFYRQYHTGPEYLVMDPTKLLEEEEREWRTSDSYWGPTAKHNAAMVANILRWGNFQKNPRAGFKQHVKYLEEKERCDRVNNCETAMQNAYNEAGLIKHLGAPFYVQGLPIGHRDFSEINKLEELERKRRMMNPEEQQLAHELAGLVGGHLQNNNELEEQERGRRMLDVRQQNIAKHNAKQVSLMVRESSSNKIKGTGPMWFSISRNSMIALEEIERTRRLRDIEGQRAARQHAKLEADLISGRLAAPAKPSIHALEEEERQSRILDRAQQQLAQRNARKVSGLVARHNLMSSGSKSFALALEESERARRLTDQAQQDQARDNARKVSSLVSSLNVAPGNKLGQQNTQATTLPRSTTLPNLSSTIPLSSAEYRQTPSPLIAAAPVYLSSSPSVQPIVLPATSTPMPVAPLASATTLPIPVRSSSFTSVPIDVVAASHPALGERERKKLQKHTEKHNKKSEKQVRKAEQSMLKAEKLHQQGRDDKAVKLEGKAEKFMKTAEHERRWASGIQGELSNAPAPASM
jgi:hypothetical protein